MMRVLMAIFMIGGAVAAVPAGAQTTAQDVQCFVAANIFAQAEKDAQRKQIAEAARLFYLGRLDARLSPTQLRAEVTAQAKGVTTTTVGPLMTSCAKAMQGKMAALQSAGQPAAQ